LASIVHHLYAGAGGGNNSTITTITARSGTVLVQSGQLAPATLTVGSGFTNSGTIELRSYNEGLCAQPPPRTPARLVDLFQAA